MGHARPKQTPAAVATPLPPLNLSQTGKQCPTTAPSAANPAASGHQRQARNTGTKPLARSSNSTAAASHLLPVRNTLVAPILPEPMARMSPFPAALASSRPNGIDPSA